MISVEEALQKILESVNVLAAETKPILDCVGQVLAEDIYSSLDVPPTDNAAMDGYAVQSDNIKGASFDHPVVLKVIGELAAGVQPYTKVGPGLAIRIMTGAQVPDGADAVVRFEDTDELKRKETSEVKEIGIRCELQGGANIRLAGEDLRKGAHALVIGKTLRPADIGLLASLGRESVSVVKRPVVAVLATGSELVEPGRPLVPGKIYNSNSYAIAAQVKSCGGVPYQLGIAPDKFDKLRSAIRRGFNSNLLITSGGVSVGDYDMVKQVLTQEGEISFWTVRMKPGKPLSFGVFNTGQGAKIPHLGLPGNPVSAMITFELFARPAIFKMMGKSSLSRPVVKAIMTDKITNKDGRRVFARVVLGKRAGGYSATLTGEQGSGVLTSMVRANGLAIVPEDVRAVNPGDPIEVMVLDVDEIGNW